MRQNRTIRIHQTALLAVVTLCAVLLAGCGASGSSLAKPPSGETASSAPTTQPAGDAEASSSGQVASAPADTASDDLDARSRAATGMSFAALTARQTGSSAAQRRLQAVRALELAERAGGNNGSTGAEPTTRPATTRPAVLPENTGEIASDSGAAPGDSGPTRVADGGGSSGAAAPTAGESRDDRARRLTGMSFEELRQRQKGPSDAQRTLQALRALDSLEGSSRGS